MRILDVAPRHSWPPVRGSMVRMYNLLRHLAPAHDVRQFSVAVSRPFPRGPDRMVSIQPRYCEYQYRSRAAALLSQAAERSWVCAPLLSGAVLRGFRPKLLLQWLRWADLVLVEFPWQFGFCRAHAAPGTPVVYASHNVEAAKFRSYADAQGVRGVRRDLWLRYIDRVERDAVKRADLVLTVSPEDRLDMMAHYSAGNPRVLSVPNGADTELYRPVDWRRKEALKLDLGLPPKPLITFAGTAVPPNVAGLDWVRRLAASTDRFTFAVIGALYSSPLRDGNFVATGIIEDYSAWLQAADISVCPIQYGGGTKLKLLEAMSAGLPVVAFAESIHGTAMEPGRHVIIAGKSVPELLAQINLLAGRRDMRQRIGVAARDFIVVNHDWRAIAGGLEQALIQLVRGRRHPRPLQSAVHSAASPG